MSTFDHDPSREVEREAEPLAEAPAPARRRRRHTPAPIHLNVTAMIDVVFLLMTYFLLLASFRPPEQAIRAEAPKRLESGALAAMTPASPDPFDLPSVPITVTIRSAGEGPEACAVAADSPALASLANLEELFTKAAAAKGPLLPPAQAFVIRPEAGARWEHALAALNALRRAGYDQVTFANPAIARVRSEH